MREIVSVIDESNYEIESELVLEHYAQLLSECDVGTMTLLILQTKETKVTKWYRMQEIFRNHEVELDFYLCDVFDASSSFYKAANNKRITTCNGSRYLFVDLPYDDTFSEHLYDYLNAMLQMNFKPVLLNVEKHSYLINDESLLKELIDLGCYISVNYESVDSKYASKILNIHAKGLCHMMFSEFLVNPEKEEEFRFWLTYSSTQYVADIVLLDNAHCMIEDQELAGISILTNILKHPTVDSELAEDRWSR